MQVGPVIIILALTLMWFVLYWLLAGILFAIVAFARFMRINTARFSCLFTLMSFATALASAWMAYRAVLGSGGRCLTQIDAVYQAIPGMFRCAPTVVLSNGVLWFIVLLAVGIGLMFISRHPERHAAGSPPTR